MEPFFSVCIDATNRHATILKCLDSVLKQDFPDYEVIICVASSDLICFSIIEEWLASSGDSRFKLFHVSRYDDESEISSWNRPIDRARGRYIAMLEGDDFYHEGHLRSAFEGISLNIGPCLFFSEGTSVSDFCLSSQTDFSYIHHYPEKLLVELLRFNWCPVPSVTVFPRLVQDLPVRYKEEAHWAAEYYLYYFLLNLPSVNVIEGTQTTVYRTPSVGTRNSFHLKDADNFLQLFGKKLERRELKEAQRKLSLWAIDYLYQNAKLGKHDSGSVQIIQKFSKKKDCIVVLFRVLIIHVSRILS